MSQHRPLAPQHALVILGWWLVIVGLLLVASTPRREPDRDPALPGAPTATAIPTAKPFPSWDREASSAASGNPSRPASPKPTHRLEEATRQGTLWWAAESFGPAYLAIPIGPGHRVTVCGPADCVELVSTDAGPDLERQREGRIADVAVGLWERICGVDRRFGGCPGSWSVQ